MGLSPTRESHRGGPTSRHVLDLNNPAFHGVAARFPAAITVDYQMSLPIRRCHQGEVAWQEFVKAALAEEVADGVYTQQEVAAMSTPGEFTAS